MKIKILLSVLSLAVAAAIIGGLYIAGSPGKQRLLRMDDQRIQDLQRIANAIDTVFTIDGKLPKDIASALTRVESPTAMIPNDPETRAPYEYRSTGSATYELCATFAFPTDEKNNMYPRPYYGEPAYPAGSTVPAPRFWNHGAGRTCFNLTVPPTPKTKS